MITNLLQQIRDLLGGLVIPDDTNLLEQIIGLLGELDALISQLQDINVELDGIHTDTTATVANTDEIKQKTAAISSRLNSFYIEAITKLHRISTGVENTHLIACETSLNSINVLTESILASLRSLGTVIDVIGENSATQNAFLEQINNNAVAINANTGASKAFLEDIATNTLNIFERDTSIAADTTAIIALLTQLLNRTVPLIGVVNKDSENLLIQPGERLLVVLDFTDKLPDGCMLGGIRAVNFAGVGSHQGYKQLDWAGFTTTGNGTKYQVAVVNPTDAEVPFKLTVGAMYCPRNT